MEQKHDERKVVESKQEKKSYEPPEFKKNHPLDSVSYVYYYYTYWFLLLFLLQLKFREKTLFKVHQYYLSQIYDLRKVIFLWPPCLEVANHNNDKKVLLVLLRKASFTAMPLIVLFDIF